MIAEHLQDKLNLWRQTLILILLSFAVLALLAFGRLCIRAEQVLAALPDSIVQAQTAITQTVRDQSREWQDMSATVITRQLEATRGLVSNEMAKTRADLRFSVLMADSRAENIQVVLDKQLSVVGNKLADQLIKAEADLNVQLGILNSNMSAVLEPTGKLLAQANDAAPLFLDCVQNSDCLFNRWVGIGRGIEKMAENGATTSKNVAKLTEDVEKFTLEITKPKPWYKHLVDFGKLGVYAVSKFVW
jgi:hypothetical protein